MQGFYNLSKATLKPIWTRDVQVRHQTDLMDMGKKELWRSVTATGISYHYVLWSVMDVLGDFFGWEL